MLFQKTQIPTAGSTFKLIEDQFANRGRTVSIILWAVTCSKFDFIIVILSFAFGVIYIMGSRKLNNTIIKFSEKNCVNDLCSVKQTLSYGSKAYVYIDYVDLSTSYFIYTKGNSYNDVFKKEGYQNNVDDCYPVATFNEYKRVMDDLGLSYSNPTIMSGIATKGNSKLSPCGLKAALYQYIGSLMLYDKDNITVTLDKREIIDHRYYNYIQSGADDYLDVSDGRFFGWYTPQIPAFGTKILYGVVENGMNGEYTIAFDRCRICINLANVFFSKSDLPTIMITSINIGLWGNFSNISFGVMLIVCGAVTLPLLISVIIIQRKQKLNAVF